MPTTDALDDLATLDHALVALRRFVSSVGPRVHDERRTVELSTLLVVDALLGAGRPLSVQALADDLDVAHSTASRLVERAAAAGMVRRAATGRDTRERPVELTDDGAALAQRGRHHRREMLAGMLRDWRPDEVAALARGLARFADAARETDGRPRP